MNGPRAGEKLGAWYLEKLIGSGGMGDVYLARRVDGVVFQTAAVKVLRSSAKEPSIEGDVLRSLHHPNIAACFDQGLTRDGYQYLVMEYVEGLPITVHADQRGLSIHERLGLFNKACGAVDHAHQHLVVHLDIKPGNVLVNSEGVVKLVDFGVAHRIAGSSGERAVPFSGPYASPEHFLSGRRLGYAADVYGLGAVLYELLCGHPPFDPFLPSAELERQIHDESPHLPSRAILQPKTTANEAGRRFKVEPEASAKMRGGCRPDEIRKALSGGLDEICLFALRKEPNRRYRSVADLRSDVEAILRGRKPPIARSGDPMYSALRVARRRPLAVVAIVACLALPYSAWVTGKSWEAGTQSGYATARLLDEVTRSTLAELDQVRAGLAPNSASATLEIVDNVQRNAAPPPPPRTFWEKFMREGANSRSRLWEIIRGK